MIRAVAFLSLLSSAAWSATQIERGEALFFEAGKGCGTCHALKGKGTAVGPDLKVMGRLSSRAIAMAIRSTGTQYVQNVKLKSGESFNGMPGAKDEKVVQVFDLSKNPPELRKLDPAEIVSMRNNEGWKHPPAVGGYTNEQLADIIAYMRYAASGARATVSPEEAQ
jgi:mono/diheme cytochrome c family protein